VIDSPQKFDVSQLIAAGATFDALTGFTYETPDVDCMVEILERATAVGLVGVHSSSGQQIKQESPVQAGGTAGTLPSRLNTEPITGRGPKFQKLRSFYRNPTGGGITIDYSILLTPLAGSRSGGSSRSAPPFRRRRRSKRR
jgi:hypothetical protein